MSLRKISVAIALCLSSVNVFAQSSYPYKSSSSSSDSDSSDMGFAFGYASNAAALYHNEPGLTGMFPVGDKGAVQIFFALYDSDPNTYGLAGIYKYTLSGNQSSGFHVGGGLGIGSWMEDRSYMHIIGDAGFHFTLKKQVVLHIDGGLLIKSDEAPAATAPKDSGMVLAGFSEHLGIALMYIF